MVDIVIGGKDFAEMLLCGAKNLSLHRAEVNDLNVFPIPDGDTGDNMLMTFSSGADAANSCSDLSSAAKAASKGMLMGARGNSGVILSRIFAGITKELSDCDKAGLKDLMRGMRSGVTEAYSSVAKPVEGTILTVFKDAVNYAEKCDNGTIVAYFALMVEEMARSLERTPELLPVLKEAGVVDSGAAGLLYIFEGMKSYVSGEAGDVEAELAATDAGLSNKAKSNVDYSLFTVDSVLEFGYCTEFLLRLQNCKTDVENFDVDRFVKQMEKMGGESVVAFKEDSILKVHVHIKTPGDILGLAQQYGEFLTVKIENMTFQNNEAVSRGNNAQTTLKRKRKKHNAFVVVAAGAGVKNAFYDLGVDAVVEGGQSMNPSARDFITAFESVNAERIFVFPNNSNIILTAKQAAELYEGSEIIVIESKSVGECYAALSLVDTEGDAETLKGEIEAAFSEVVTAFVSNASRDADFSGVAVHCGDYIGFARGEVYCDSPERSVAVRELLTGLNAKDFGVLIIFKGVDVDMQEAESLVDELSLNYKDLEIVLVDGGQPIYDYMLVLE